ncbi:MAG: aminopeptidase P family protein [Oscillospiraceae bacterium]|nr:aminopeptidase P family protein [Oscillospiraceae bacterium]
MNNLKKLLADQGEHTAALIISPENRRYFTSFPSSDGYLLVNGERAVFITDGRYIEAAENSAKDCEVVLQERIYPQIGQILEEMGCQNLLVESSRMTVSVYNSLKGVLKKTSISTDDALDKMINSLRSVKTAEEIESIKAAQKITDDAFTHILGFIKPGVTEREIGLELDSYMLSHGGEALSFETIAVSGKNSSMPHGVPSDKKIENGDFITMDYGTVVNGYHSDMTRTVAVGYADDEMKKVYKTVLAAQKACLEGLKSGLSCRDGDALARKVIEDAGYGKYFTHSTGHGVGVEIHEFPNLSPSSDTVLTPGHIVTVEPGIYIPGKFGVRIEDMAVITENGCEDITHSPKELIIL